MTEFVEFTTEGGEPLWVNPGTVATVEHCEVSADEPGAQLTFVNGEREIVRGRLVDVIAQLSPRQDAER